VFLCFGVPFRVNILDDFEGIHIEENVSKEGKAVGFT